MGSSTIGDFWIFYADLESSLGRDGPDVGRYEDTNHFISLICQFVPKLMTLVWWTDLHAGRNKTEFQVGHISNYQNDINVTLR